MRAPQVTMGHRMPKLLMSRPTLLAVFAMCHEVAVLHLRPAPGSTLAGGR